MSIVKIAFFVRFINDTCSVSLRSKDEVNVSKVASIFGGGGHFNAAGCTIETKDVLEAKNLILKEILEIYK